MKAFLKVLIGLSIFTFSTSSLYAADAVAGEKKSAMCSSCHGDKGVNKNSLYPNLAGQKPSYLANQLRAFKKGTRTNPMMQHITKKLSIEDIDNLAAYFASLENESKHKSKETVTEKTVTKSSMCKGCHGSNGEGRGTFPKLSNQHIKYLEKQLQAFKSGDRKSSMMQGMVRALNDNDIKQLSIYFSGLGAETE